MGFDAVGRGIELSGDDGTYGEPCQRIGHDYEETLHYIGVGEACG